MTADLIHFPPRAVAIADAREVLRNPHCYSDATLLDAAEVLISWGDWEDVRRAEMMRRAVTLHPRPEPAVASLSPLVLPAWGWLLLGAAALALGIAAAVVVAGVQADQILRGAVEW